MLLRLYFYRWAVAASSFHTLLNLQGWTLCCLIVIETDARLYPIVKLWLPLISLRSKKQSQPYGVLLPLGLRVGLNLFCIRCHLCRIRCKHTVKNLKNMSGAYCMMWVGLRGCRFFLQALLGGSVLVIPEVAAEVSEQVQLFSRCGVNSLSATPSLWKKILMTAQCGSLLLKNITLGGEIVDQSILDMLNAKFPRAKIRHIYASTEAGVGFSVSDGKAGFPLAYLNRSALGVTLKISDAGHLLMGSASLSMGYLGADLEYEARFSGYGR